MKPNENYLAGALVVVAGFIVLYYYNKKRESAGQVFDSSPQETAENSVTNTTKV